MSVDLAHFPGSGARTTASVSRRVSVGRVLVVLFGLVVSGAAAGAVAGVVGATIWVTLMEGAGAGLDFRIWVIAGLIGAPFGAVLLPLAGFTALRRVPVGRILLLTTSCTALCTAIGTTLYPAAWLASAIAGFLFATGWLWYQVRVRR